MNSDIKRYVNDKLGNKLSPVILEIGAHYGEDTIDIMDVFNYPNTCCFEPHPGNAAFMREYFKMINDVAITDKGDIYLFEVALSDVDGETTFNIINSPLPEDKKVPDKYRWIDEESYRKFNLNDSGGSSIKWGYRPNDIKKVTVNTMKLDSWAEGTGVDEVDFIWMDVQGAEREVVEGGRNLFEKTKYVWTEVGETCYEGGMDKRETIKLFAELNFSPLEVNDRNNLLFERS